MANSYLSRTPSGAGNRRTFTISAWVKRSKLDNTGGGQQDIIACSTANNTFWILYFASNDDSLVVYEAASGATKMYVDFSASTAPKLRDVNGWYHIVVAVDTTQATDTNRLKLWVNNQQLTPSNSTYPTQNYDSLFNTAIRHDIGAQGSGFSAGTNTFDGYMTHVILVDGTALTPSSFGQADSTTGQWKFKGPSGVTFGTNGFHLKFENSGNLGADSAGSNNFTVNGDLKQALDTPSNIYCTINPLHTINSDTTLSNGNTRFDGLSGSPYDAACGGTLGFNKGKWYWEWKWGLTGSGNQAAFVGIIDTEIPIVAGGNPSKGVTYRPDAGAVRKDGSEVSSAYSGSANDIFGMAFDMDAGTLKLHKNGTYFNSGNAVVTGIDLTKTYVPYIGPNGGTTQSNIYMNWGNGFFGTTAITSAGSNGNGSLFEYDVPSGFYALNTKNLNTYG